MKNVLTIAGSDSSGGAGIQADLKTFSANGVYGMSVITAVTAQNTKGVFDVQDIDADIIKAQIDAIFTDIKVDSIKIGMVSRVDTINAISEKLKEYKPINIVLDPVMISKSGYSLLKPESKKTLITKLIPLADIITPNIPEAEEILREVDAKITSIKTVEDMEKAAKEIYKFGCKNVLLKGGHMIGDAIDILYNGKEFFYFHSERIHTKNTHGTGCTLSSAIASNLALGFNVNDSVRKAKSYITKAIIHSLDIGHGVGPTNHFYELYKKAGLITEHPYDDIEESVCPSYDNVLTKSHKDIGKLLSKLRGKSPLVHHITNYVTVNDCANITLAIGGSPVMADDINEIEDMVSIASSLVLNIGTLNNRTVESIILAGKKANELNIPVVLDPVGAGATPYRTKIAKKIMEEIKLSVIRGNLSEIKTLYGIKTQTKGVDSVDNISSNENDFIKTKKLAMDFANKLDTIITITGEVDIITDGKHTYTIKNGHEMMSKVTGTGCMCTSLIGSYLGSGKDNLASALAGVVSMGIAGEMAFERLGQCGGSGSLKINILDAIYNLSEEVIVKRGKIYED